MHSVPGLFTDFLKALDVPFTGAYSARRFADMPFQRLFGLMCLLKEYGVDSEAYRITDPEKVKSLPCPFLADTPGGFIVVTDMDAETGRVRYVSDGVAEEMDIAGFLKARNDIVLLAYPRSGAGEPDYVVHARMEFLGRAKKWMLVAASVAIVVYAIVVNHLYTHVSLLGALVLDVLGLYFSFLLVQKSLNIRNTHADRVCGVLQKGGCDDVLKRSAAKFFGLFGWSEVGMAYFSVSLLALLMFPEATGALALCNLCCLPFTAWSIWYQKFRAKAWCTLCVSVQGLLWLLFICYLSGGWIKVGWTPGVDFVVLGICYVAALLGINALTSFMKSPETNNE